MGSASIPSLQALRAFDAVARELSFRKAAIELNLTPAAVSHQIKGLEEFLGVRLCERGRAQVVLTASGQRYLSTVRPALAQLESASLEMRGGPGRRLSLDVLPSLASRWLMPRMGRFMQAHPGIDLRIAATQTLVSPTSDSEISIRYGRGTWAGVSAERLCDEYLFPVISPALLETPAAARSDWPSGVPLLRDTHESWQHWMAAAHLSSGDFPLGPRFDDSGLLLQAAEAGQGIALARSLLVSDAVKKGQLVKIGTVQVASPNAYFLVRPPATDLSPAAAHFVVWLKAELRHLARSGEDQ